MITKTDIRPIKGKAILRPAFEYTGKVKFVNLGMGKKIGTTNPIKKK